MSRRIMLAASVAVICLFMLGFTGCSNEPKTGLEVEIGFIPGGETDPTGDPMIIKHAKVGDVYKSKVRATDINGQDEEWDVEIRFQDLTPEAAMFDFVILYFTKDDRQPYNFSRTTVIELGQSEKFKHPSNHFFEGVNRIGFEVKVTQK